MKCPGQDMQYWNAEAIYEVKCPQCGHLVEFYKDDTSRKCGKCEQRFVNPKMDFGCASYCQFASQCLGTLPEEFTSQRDNLLKDRVAVEMKRYFRSRFKQISHASRVARHAEKIGQIEEGNLAIILCAAYLLHIGQPEAERKYGESATDHVAEEGIAVTQKILNHLGANEQLTAAVCTIIEWQFSKNTMQNKESKAVADAELLAIFEEQLMVGVYKLMGF